MEYKVLASPVTFEEEIKKSKFITYLKRVENLADARAFYAQLKREHPKAVHVCWATVAGLPGNEFEYFSSDDGEPSGTAGRPMLNTLINSQIGFIMAATVRYFGGILLGTGGLVKAYSNGVQQALKLAQTTTELERELYFVTCSYEQINLVQNLLQQFNANIEFQEFMEEVTTEFAIPVENVEAMQNLLLDRSAGTLFMYKIE
ncbi:YigZ family protein [Psittacicella melopsittaci]|uniref:YigZ family protein n=1 Tax=Psittacicella melopsittaci TaxID=2028576 RepID=A0A3A1Y807_9GAMM|nr:YigZ family protein [Psittacicella melopsittaci]RIY32257.1 YigZ family protein [Psittacicella melopsittaci]